MVRVTQAEWNRMQAEAWEDLMDEWEHAEEARYQACADHDRWDGWDQGDIGNPEIEAEHKKAMAEHALEVQWQNFCNFWGLLSDWHDPDRLPF